MKEKTKKEVFDLRISLRFIDPPIWRLVAVPSEIPLQALHLTIQGAMGWNNSHLHAFKIAGKRFEGGIGSRTPLERKVHVGDVFEYIYDFGDHWEHEILVERVYEVKSRRHYPKCLDGARTGPPDDVGGPPGYARFIDILGNAAHPEHDETAAWARAYWHNGYSFINFGSECFSVSVGCRPSCKGAVNALEVVQKAGNAA